LKQGIGIRIVQIQTIPNPR